MRHTIRMIVVALATCLSLLVFTMGCGSSSDSVTLSSIGVSPTSVSIVKGTTKQFTATGTYSDGTTKALGAGLTWSSSDEKIATISNDLATFGLATGVAKGSASLTATLTENGVTVHGGTLVTVSDVALKSLTLSTATLKLAKGTMAMLVATGTFADDSTQDLTESVDWSSSAAAIASVSSAPGSKGVVTAAGQGTATLTANLGDVKATVEVSVTMAALEGLSLASPEPWIAKGMSAQFGALGIFSDGTTQDLTFQVVWASSDPSVSISNAKGEKGLATGVAEGETTISATLMGVVGAEPFKVTSATVTSIAVTPTNPAIAAGTSLQFLATGILSDGSFRDLSAFATWTSAVAATATVSNDPGSKGLASGVAAGVSTISASYAGKSGSSDLAITAATLTKIDLTPLNPALAKGVALQFAAIGTFSDKSTQDLTTMASWGSTDLGVASISTMIATRGLAMALAEGTTTISASINGKSDSTVLTVTAATLSYVTLTPPNPTIAKGTSVALFATGTYSDATTQDLTYVSTWKSSGPSVIVDDWFWHKGTSFGVSPGASTVSATYGGKTGFTTVNVSVATLSAISVTPPNATLAKGTSMKLSATGTYSDNSTQDLSAAVTWSSSDASVIISNAFGSHGLATGLVVGQSTISAKLGAQVGQTLLAVSAATLTSIAVTPADGAIAKGSALQFKATGTYSDNSKQDLTVAVSWSSSSPSVSISNMPLFSGLAQGLSQGEATISANLGGKSGATTLTVTAATLSALTILPATATIAKGTIQWFSVSGTYTDNSVQDLSNFASYGSSDPSKVIISNVAGSRGLATAVAEGEVTITAFYQGKSTMAALTVSAATLASIAITPANASMPLASTLPFVATGTYTDNSTQVITMLVTWQSSKPSVAIISNAAGSRGLVTSITAGMTTLSAFGSGKTGMTTLTVGD